MKAKRYIKRAVAFVLTAALLAGIAAVSYIPAVNYDASILGEFHHYNGIFFSNFTAEGADMEGALAVAGKAVLGSKDGKFDIGTASTGSYHVAGTGDHFDGSLPVALFGEVPSRNGNTAGWVNFYGKGGPVVVPAGKEAATETALGSKSTVGSGSTPVTGLDEGQIRAFFTDAYNTTTHAMEKLEKTYTSDTKNQLTAAQLTGWTGSQNAKTNFSSANIGKYEKELTFSNGQTKKVLVIHITNSGSVTINEPYINETFKDYPLVVFNFPNATDVKFQYAGVYVEGKQLSASDTSSSMRSLLREYCPLLVWTMPKATSVSTTSCDVMGSVIAPNAHVNGNGGSINGMVVANSFYTQNGCELHSFRMNMPVFNLDPDPNDVVTGSVELHKYEQLDDDDESRGNLLPGAKFELWRVEEGSGNKTQITNSDANISSSQFDTDGKTLITDGAGMITVNGLEEGTYYFEETDPPAGYEADRTQKYYFSIRPGQGDTEPIDIKVYNKKKSVDIDFEKVDESSGDPLEGAEFELYQVFERIRLQLLHQKQTSGANGHFTLENLEIGSYILVEAVAPEGYEVPEHFWRIEVVENSSGDLVVSIEDSNGIPVTAAGGTYEIENKIIDETDPNDDGYRIIVTKRDSTNENRVLEGAKFKVYSHNDYVGMTDSQIEAVNIDGISTDPTSGKWDLYHAPISNATEFVTDESGRASLEFNTLVYGVYMIEETDAPKGYTGLDKNFIFKVPFSTNDFSQPFAASPLMAPIAATVVLEAGEEEETASEESGVEAPENDLTDQDQPDNQEDAVEPSLHGNDAPQSDTSDHKQSATNDTEAESAPSALEDEVFYFTPTPSSPGEDADNAAELLEDSVDDDSDEPPQENADPPEDGENEDEDPTSPTDQAGGEPEDSLAEDNTDEEVESEKGNSEAMAAGAMMAAAFYSAPISFYDDNENLYMTITTVGKTYYVDVYNQPDTGELGKITVEKIDKDVWDNSNQKEYVQGAEFYLYYGYSLDASNIPSRWVKYADGYSDENGICEFENLPQGFYRVMEVTAPPGYEEITDPEPVVESMTDDYAVEIDFNQPGTVHSFVFVAANPKIKTGTLRAHKVDGDTNANLSGARFTLEYFNEQDNSFGSPPNGIAAVHESDKNGQIYLTGLPYGLYKVTESTPPSGYAVDSEYGANELFFTISADSLNNTLNIYGGMIYNIANYKKSTGGGGGSGGGGISLVPIYPDFDPLGNLILTDPEVVPPMPAETINPPGSDNPSMGDLRDIILYGIVALTFGSLLAALGVRQWRRWKYFHMT